MQEKLDRKELPIQSIREREEDCTATIPIHLGIIELPEKVRTDLSLIKDARDTVEAWYNEDMEYHFGVLRADGECDAIIRMLQNYARFRDEWRLDGRPDENGFLELLWKENGKSHIVKFNPVPVILRNSHNKFGEFYTPEFNYKTRELIEIFYRDVITPECVFMSPQKMRKYGIETDIARVREKKRRFP